MPGRKWTEEQRRELSERMLQAKIWEKSTGPKTEEGKERCSYNAFKHGNHSLNSREMHTLLKKQNRLIEHLEMLLKIEEKIR